MKALLLKTSVWLVLLFSVMGLWHVSNAAEQHTPMKAQAATTDKQQVTPTKEAAHQSGEEAATNVSASVQGTADDTNNKVTSNAPSNKPSTAVSTTVNETRDVDAQ
ncbi:TPA: multifunctional 2',3'-cyclic-nucleotide 2'-phosphodiesterase/5'-nucleotidase/3'-nucleotidase, partial [Staphylococcus aureus]|nr:multifunctional 2',3'-cyclic-nucleotide 2'-phosphodiesterase/5'-nucleotidase/3'-nucleotidase [Staphylococcus aureus]